MDKKRKDGYVTGIGCLLIFALFAYFTIVSASNTSAAVIMGIFAALFGVLGFGSLAKPETIGAVASQFLENLSKNSEEKSSDSHDKQIQKKSSGSVQVMASDSEVNINVLPRKQKPARESDVKGSALWKPLPKINFNVAQRLLRMLQFPTVGWEAYNDSPYQLRVRIEVHPILGGRDLHPLPDNLLNGTEVIDVEPQSALFGNGCFTLPEICAVSKDDELILEIRAKVEDINDPEKGQYKLVPQRWKYVRETNTWSYYPQRRMAQ